MNTDTNSLSYSEPSLRDRITRTAFVWGAGHKNHITNEVPLGAIVLNANLADANFGSVTTLCGKTTSTAFLDFDGNINPTNICKACSAKAGK
jgi:hypothetical protein